ncbi:MAG TPA: FHA domain-containing protein [Chitinophagales bacterium]|nr:FHA domain-containing protein [Chitinophagales bacterium]HRK27350.1 FHA domain-containing protein [Chitinophagales bacterium]
MAKIQCYNCKKVTPVVAPKYRCKFCNYPLNKYLEQPEKQPEEEVVIENIKQVEETPERSINDVFRVQQEQIDIKTILEKLKPDEKIEKSVTGQVIIKENKNPEKSGKIVAGWLVVHTEGKLPVTYELFEGKNVIGRPDGPHHVDIRVEDDEYVSRIHALIYINKDFLHRFSYRLADDGSLRGGHPSTNGTYINGITDRLPKDSSVFLRDADTVQVGTTKMVFKSTDVSDDHYSAANSVLNTEFTNTVAILKK